MANNRIERLLQNTGLPYRESRFPAPPPSRAYLTYTDTVQTDGPDGLHALDLHTVTIGLHEEVCGSHRDLLEAQLDAAELRWTRGTPYWLEQARGFETDYIIEYTEKHPGWRRG